MKWNFLVVDDDSKIAEQTCEVLQSKRTMDGEQISCEVCSDFESAKSKVLSTRYDLIILDLQDDVSKVEMKGKEILDVLREAHFVPVIFYSGHAGKVSALQTPFVRVVSKGDDDIDNLRNAVREVFSTGLPKLIRFIQDQQKSYLWQHVDEFWQNSGPICDVKDLACLLSKRLSNALKGESVRRHFDGVEDSIAHPIEMYVWPSLGNEIQTGDLLEMEDKLYVVLNPACDFSQGKVNNIVAAECVRLNSCQEYLELASQKSLGSDYTKAQLSALRSLIGDNRQGKKVQPDRFKYLPATVFMEAAVVDFQLLISFPFDKAACPKRIATLDTPFVESLLSKFSRYYGRIGTLNLDAKSLLGDVVSNIP
ncbi:hypothetical protein ALP68_03689 [Pseudomonas ficuserectae]|uniref:response regulator n=1 Tax=Pseudomonas ficuserectae TaxID=53410 RepID=UPI000EFEBFE0|nr:response regulator [Pseudomonas ficuserectae]RMS28819.1 hypothetical protein ALP68_03689 [Pseudomonas ficuserectae]RMS38730.1 hypothetical protein ALP67_00787 [Pseudomonas ficuserectae]